MLHDARDVGNLGSKLVAAKLAAAGSKGPGRGRWSQLSTAYDNFRPLVLEEEPGAPSTPMAASPKTPRHATPLDTSVSFRSPVLHGKGFKKSKKRNIFQRFRDHIRRKLGLNPRRMH